MVTLADVAQHAGVSASTVSYVLGGKRTISAPTRERVERSIAELGHRPNAGAVHWRAAGPTSSPAALLGVAGRRVRPGGPPPQPTCGVGATRGLSVRPAILPAGEWNATSWIGLFDVGSQVS